MPSGIHAPSYLIKQKRTKRKHPAKYQKQKRKEFIEKLLPNSPYCFGDIEKINFPSV